MAQYQIGNDIYEIPDGTPQATVNDIINQITLGMANQGTSQQTDNAFEYSVDQAQRLGGKGLEAVGRLTGLKGLEQFGTDVVKQQDIDIAKGGYKPKFTKSFADTFDEQGIGAAFEWIGEKIAENSVSTGASLAGAGATAVAAMFSAPVAAVLGAGTLVGSTLLGTGEAASEIEDKTGSYDPKLAVGAGAVIGFLDKFGAGKVIPKDQLTKMTVKQMATKLADSGYKEAAKELIKRTVKKGGFEGITEMGQESVSMGASALSGGEYTAKEVKDRLIDSGVIGTSMGSGVSVGTDAVTGGVNTVRKVKDGVTSVFDKKTKEPNDPEGATELAQRLDTIATANDYDLQDLDKMSTKGARETVDKAHIQVAEELKQLGKDLKERLQVSPTDELSVVIDKVLAQAGQREARNKTKSTVGKQEFDAITRLTGDTFEGQRMLSLMRQMNELTELHNSGYQQGLSRITDNFSPIGSGLGYDKSAINTERVLRPLASLGAGATTGGASLLGQLGIVAGGRAIDKLRGINKSVVDDYIQRNKDGQGIDLGNNPSLRQQAIADAQKAEIQALAEEQQKLQEQENLRNLRMQLDDENAPPTPNSPQFVVEDATGLTKQQVEEVLQLIEQTPNLNPALQKSINDYRTSVRTGGQVSNINDFIRAVNSAIEANGITRTNPQNQSSMQQGTGGRPSYQNNPNYLRGIEDNRAFADELIEAVNNDNSINVVDKPLLTQALLNLKKNLGSRPMETGTRIVEDLATRLKNPEAIQQYVAPYLDRVTGQQSGQQPTEIIEEYKELKNPEEKAPKRSLTEIGQELEALQNEKYGRKLDIINNEDDFQIVKNQMRDEAQSQLDKDPNDAQWYDNDITEAINTTSEAIPDILLNDDNKDLLLLLTAVTSIGEKPILNWRQGSTLALHYFNTGQIGEAIQINDEARIVNPSTGKILGFKGKSKEPALRIISHMINTMGLKNTMEWLHANKTKREIDAMRAEVGLGGQNKILGGLDVVVPGIMIFGQKVAPFYLNLKGIKDVTVDLWASRGIRRITGGLINPLFGKSKNATALIDSPTAAELPTFKRLYTEVGNELGISPQASQALLWKYEQDLYNDVGGNFIHEKFSQGAKAFLEKDTLVYEGRYGQPVTRSSRGTENDVQQEEQSGILTINADPQLSRGQRPGRTRNNRTLEPTPTEINDQLPTINKAFEVGKKGSPHENGLNVNEALQIGKALGFTIIMAPDNETIKKLYGKPLEKGTNLGGFAAMKFDNDVVTPTRIAIKQAQSKNDEARAIFTGFHEVSHGLANQQGMSTKPLLDMGYGRDNAEPKMTYRGSPESELAVLFNRIHAKVPDAKLGQRIANEMKRIRFSSFAREGAALTPFLRGELLIPRQDTILKRLRDAEIQKEANEAQAREDAYELNISEILADNIAAYLIDPKKYKSIAPTTAKFLQDTLNSKPSSKFVKFYANPLSTVLAVIMSALALDDQEEEMPEGALQLGQGALSA